VRIALLSRDRCRSALAIIQQLHLQSLIYFAECNKHLRPLQLHSALPQPPVAPVAAAQVLVLSICRSTRRFAKVRF
jgi:hypothetical protein